MPTCAQRYARLGSKTSSSSQLRSGRLSSGLSKSNPVRIRKPHVHVAATYVLLETLAAQASVTLENSRLVDRLRFDANHDSLTGLPNRRRMVAALEEAVKINAARRGRCGLGVRRGRTPGCQRVAWPFSGRPGASRVRHPVASVLACGCARRTYWWRQVRGDDAHGRCRKRLSHSVHPFARSLRVPTEIGLASRRHR